MQINPEVLRNYWLSFSVHRMIIAPIVMLAIIFLIFKGAQVKGDFNWNKSDVAPYAAAMMTSIVLYCFIIFVWGGYSAAGAVLGQINDKTWDYQRLSSISPWSLSWGTVFGSTLFVWYCAITSLAFAFFYANFFLPLNVILQGMFVLLAGGIYTILVVSLIGLQALQTSDRSGKRRSIGYRLLGIIIGLNMLSYTISLLPFQDVTAFVNPGTNQFVTELNIKFYGFEIPIRSFFITSMLIFSLWAFFGVYRTMRTELQMRSTPWGWTVFLLFLFFYFGNFSFQSGTVWQNEAQSFSLLNPVNIGSVNLDYFFSIAFGISLLSCYVMFFSDHLSITRYRMLQHRLARGQLMRAAELIPRMAISYLFALIAGLVLIILNPSVSVKSNFIPAFLTLAALLLFTLRDIAILHYFSLARDNRRAFLATIFYLAILYYLLPLLFFSVGIRSYSFFYPPIFTTNWQDLIPILLQLAAVFILIYLRWQSAYEPIKQQTQATQQAA
ncbi:MAG: hypothetical protein ACRBBN_21485 [Methyloligellaceae bacterium]